MARAAAPAPVVVIPIDGMVDDGMAHMVARSIAQANDEHAAAVVLDVNSLGGLVEAALSIIGLDFLGQRTGRSPTLRIARFRPLR